MEKRIYYNQRQEGYKKVLEEVKSNAAKRSEFENMMNLRMHSWWADWKPDYEGWLKLADSLYANECIIDAIGPTPQVYKDYRASMKHQRDAFDMDMGPIENCVVEGDTIAFDYKMYMTPKADMDNLKKGNTITLNVTEFNKFANVAGYNKPMVVHLKLVASGL